MAHRIVEALFNTAIKLSVGVLSIAIIAAGIFVFGGGLYWFVPAVQHYGCY
jgi:hypothetical protein